MWFSVGNTKFDSQKWVFFCRHRWWCWRRMCVFFPPSHSAPCCDRFLSNMPNIPFTFSHTFKQTSHLCPGYHVMATRMGTIKYFWTIVFRNATHFLCHTVISSMSLPFWNVLNGKWHWHAFERYSIFFLLLFLLLWNAVRIFRNIIRTKFEPGRPHFMNFLHFLNSSENSLNFDKFRLLMFVHLGAEFLRNVEKLIVKWYSCHPICCLP